MNHRCSLLALCLMALVFAAPARAMLIENGGFTQGPDGLDGWKGGSQDSGFTDTFYSSPLPASLFVVSGGQATGMTDIARVDANNNPDPVISVILFQEVDLTGIPPDTALKLSFDLVNLVAAGGFFGGINYGCAAGFTTPCTGFVDLLDGAGAAKNYMKVVPDAAGTLAVVSFSVLALPGANATFTIDNVSLTTTTLPEPSTVVLLMFGLLLASRCRHPVD